MPIHYGRWASCSGGPLLLALVVISPNNAFAQISGSEPISIVREERTARRITRPRQAARPVRCTANSKAALGPAPRFGLLTSDVARADRSASRRRDVELAPPTLPRGLFIGRARLGEVPAVTDYPVQQKAHGETNRTSRPPVDGTWHEDGQYVTIQLDGREVRLRKTSGATVARGLEEGRKKPANHAVAEAGPAGGEGAIVFGRLMNHGRPVVKCKVSLIPLRRSGGGHTIDGKAEAHNTQTDEEGNYRFEEVPRGPYKLFWLPSGQNQWIRRIEFKPDVVVQSRAASRIKDIRVALRTIN